jgi:ketopantoate reductase
MWSCRVLKMKAARGAGLWAILAGLNSNTRSELARPSMGQDMYKGQRTEIDFINGVIT